MQILNPKNKRILLLILILGAILRIIFLYVEGLAEFKTTAVRSRLSA